MHWLPYQKLTLVTRLSPAEVHKRIAENLAPRKTRGWYWPWKRPDKPYWGEVSANGFTIVRVIGYQNSFLPIIIGSVSSQLGKTHLTITFRLHHAILAFQVIWYALLLPQAIQSARQARPYAALPPLGMCLFMYVLSLSAFSIETAKSRRFLAQILEPIA